MKIKIAHFVADTSVIAALCVMLGGLFYFSGCASVAPGQDAVVVRAEQTEATAQNAVKTILSIDASNRSFYSTNAPEFHLFCEQLRSPVNYGSYTVPKVEAMILSLDDVKLAYKRGLASSNDVVMAIEMVGAVANQAAYWQKNYTK